ncbi:MAG: hypothetical protein QME68_08030, partial [Elusimicrobiota bacterium]|nr:hypothetical protein [Elusimicrobiota bacterium]
YEFFTFHHGDKLIGINVFPRDYDLLVIYARQGTYAHVSIPNRFGDNIWAECAIKSTALSGVSWAPGLILYWDTSAWIRVSLDETGKLLAILRGTASKSIQASINKWYYVRIKLFPQSVKFEYRPEDSTDWQIFWEYYRPINVLGAPKEIILGKGYEFSPKYPNAHLDNDATIIGRLGYSYIKDFRIWSSEFAATISGFSGSKNIETATAIDVPFNQTSETENKIRFKVSDIAGNEGTSLAYTVKIDTIPPQAPLLVSPQNNISVNELKFNWEQSQDIGSGIKNYLLQVDTTSSFYSPLRSVYLTTTSTEISKYGVPQEVTVQYNFEDGTDTGWQKISGKWTVEQDPWNPANKIYCGAAIDKQAISLTGDVSWTDYTIELYGSYPVLDMQIQGVIFRYKDSNNYYLLTLDVWFPAPNISLYRIKNGIQTLLYSGGNRYSMGNTKIEVVGNLIQCYFDESLFFEVTDTDPILNGKIGLYSGGDSVYYDNIKVTVKVPLVELKDGSYFWRVSAFDKATNQSAWSEIRSFILDTKPPAKITDLTAQRLDNGK